MSTENERSETSHILRFFQQEEERLRRGTSMMRSPWPMAYVAPVVLVFIVLGLLILLESNAPVWAYILVLLSVAATGFRQIRITELATADAVKHTAEVERRRLAGANRQQLVTHLETRITADDRSHAAEAIHGFLLGKAGPEAVAPTARSAFSETENLSEFTNFLRGALILGGLFGTVLFFAWELTGLTGAGLAQGQAELLRGLRGALASTLTGIAGALSLGLLANHLGRRIGKIIQETETFLAASLLPLNLKDRGTAPPETEAELWEALRAEVENLSDKVAKRAENMADDASAYAKSLEEVNKRLAELPQIQIPPQLANLEEAVSKFSGGTTLLHETSTQLIESVSALGVFAPARLVSDLDALRTEVSKWKTESKEELEKVGTRVDTAAKNLGSQGEAIASKAAATIDARLGALTGASQRLEEAVPKLQSLIETARESFESSTQQVVASGQRIESLKEDLGGLPEQVDAVLDDIQNEIKELQQVAALSSPDIVSSPGADGHGSSGNLKLQREMMLRLRELDGLIEWHRNARRGFLWKLLEMPLLPKGRLPFMPRRR